MSGLKALFLTVWVIFSPAIRCDEAQEDFLAREPAVVARAAKQWEAQLFQPNKSTQTTQTPFTPVLDGRTLLDSWMGKRQQTCEDTGYSLCTGVYPPHFPNIQFENNKN
jgi:hypothetical protein